MPRTSGTHDGEARSSRSKLPRQHEIVEELLLPQVHNEFFLWEGCSREAKSRLRKAESDEEIFTLVAWIRAFNINEPIYAELCHEFYSTYEFDEVCVDDELQSKKIIKFRLGERAHNLTLMTGYDKIQKNDLWLLSMFDARHQNGYENVAWVIVKWMKRKGAGTQKESQFCCGPPEGTSMQDLYDMMGRMEIRKEAIREIELGSHITGRYSVQGVFEAYGWVYSVPLQGAYHPPGAPILALLMGLRTLLLIDDASHKD
ncbi:hypothetical protein Tco_0574468 [Tanacetum coccineum]